MSTPTFAEIRAQQIGYWNDVLRYQTWHWWPGSTPTFHASTDPTSSDDFGKGYRTGQFWLNLATNELFILEDASFGAAVWNSVNGTGSGASGQTKVAYDILAGASQIDTFPARAARYVIGVWTTAKTRTLQLMVTRQSGATTDSVFGVTGDAMDVSFSTSASGSDILLTIQNNESLPIHVEIIREVLG